MLMPASAAIAWMTCITLLRGSGRVRHLHSTRSHAVGIACLGQQRFGLFDIAAFDRIILHHTKAMWAEKGWLPAAKAPSNTT